MVSVLLIANCQNIILQNYMYQFFVLPPTWLSICFKIMFTYAFNFRVFFLHSSSFNSVFGICETMRIFQKLKLPKQVSSEIDHLYFLLLWSFSSCLIAYFNYRILCYTLILLWLVLSYCPFLKISQSLLHACLSLWNFSTGFSISVVLLRPNDQGILMQFKASKTSKNAIWHFFFATSGDSWHKLWLGGNLLQIYICLLNNTS